MTQEKKLDSNIYMDVKTGDVIVSKKGENNSYSFYATKVEKNSNVTDIDFSKLRPIDDIFDYIERNNLNVNVLSKKIVSTGEKKHGK